MKLKLTGCLGFLLANGRKSMRYFRANYCLETNNPTFLLISYEICEIANKYISSSAIQKPSSAVKFMRVYVLCILGKYVPYLYHNIQFEVGYSFKRGTSNVIYRVLRWKWKITVKTGRLLWYFRLSYFWDGKFFSWS